MNDLAGKHIVLGLSGGIACYKAAELCRALIKEGATVQVVMTAAAQQFIAAFVQRDDLDLGAAEVYAQSHCLPTWSQKVTGPSLTRLTFMSAPNTPVATLP